MKWKNEMRMLNVFWVLLVDLKGIHERTEDGQNGEKKIMRYKNSEQALLINTLNVCVTQLNNKSVSKNQIKFFH